VVFQAENAFALFIDPAVSRDVQDIVENKGNRRKNSMDILKTRLNLFLIGL
jgi:hypothetical protein